ncbi:MAG: hypothetical protein SVO26_04350 [Chloroflexota bacterium]|nr:hypothetical protein [Chloroflexota bacterium]
MKVMIGQMDQQEAALWQGEALTASWDHKNDEFVIRSDNPRLAHASAASEAAKEYQLVVEIEDTGLGLVVWRGYVGTADFVLFEDEQVDSCLIMLLDEWLGIVPQFSMS